MVYIFAKNWKMGRKRWMVAESLPLLLTIALSLLAIAYEGQKAEGEGTESLESPGTTENGFFSPC